LTGGSPRLNTAGEGHRRSSELGVPVPDQELQAVGPVLEFHQQVPGLLGYLDTSAALKLVMPEAETAGLELWIAERAGVPRVSSRLLRIEMLRSVARTAPQRMSRANVVLSAVALVSMDDVASTAEVVGDRTLRSLDAIHLATAQELRAELTAFVCYDKCLQDSAHALGLPVEAPS
jgi:uncharacterized protein